MSGAKKRLVVVGGDAAGRSAATPGAAASLARRVGGPGSRERTYDPVHVAARVVSRVEQG